MDPRPSSAETARFARRYFLGECGVGIGSVALASLLGRDRLSSAGEDTTEASIINPYAPRPSHYAPRAKHVIFLFMAGGPSQLELFDRKPELAKHDGKQVPAEVIEGFDLPFIERDAALMASPVKFSRHGQCGAEISEMLPHLGSVADDIAIVNRSAASPATWSRLKHRGATPRKQDLDVRRPERSLERRTSGRTLRSNASGGRIRPLAR